MLIIMSNGFWFRRLRIAMRKEGKIHMLQGKDNPIELNAAELLIGRDKNKNDIVLDDVRVSDEHCLLKKPFWGKWRVIDLGSKNGVLLRKRGRREKVKIESAKVKKGDELTLGKTRLLFA